MILNCNLGFVFLLRSMCCVLSMLYLFVQILTKMTCPEASAMAQLQCKLLIFYQFKRQIRCVERASYSDTP